MRLHRLGLGEFFSAVLLAAVILHGCSQPPRTCSPSASSATPPQVSEERSAAQREPITTGTTRPPADVPPPSEPDRAALAEVIRRRAVEAQRRPNASPGAPTAVPSPTGGSSPAAAPTAAPDATPAATPAAAPGAAPPATDGSVQTPGRSRDLLAAQDPRTPPPSAAGAPAAAPAADHRTASPGALSAAAVGPPPRPMELVPPLEGTPQPRVQNRTPVGRVHAVWKGRPAVFRFDLANAGEAPLLIRVKPCCGVQLNGPADRSIPPGESETVELVMQTVRPGPISRKVLVATNDRTAPEVALECAANVLTGLKVEPFNAAFGQVDRGAGPQTRTLTLTRGDGGPIAPRIVNNGHPNVTAAVEEVTPGERYLLHVTVGPPWPNGPLSGAVELETGVPEDPRENIPVFASIAPRLAAVPAQFLFDGELKTDAQQTLHLRWAGGPPGQILSATANMKDAQVTFAPAEPGGDPTVTLRVPAGYTPDPRATYFVTIRTDDPEAPQIQVPVAFRRVSVIPPGTAERIPGAKPPRPPR